MRKSRLGSPHPAICQCSRWCSPPHWARVELWAFPAAPGPLAVERRATLKGLRRPVEALRMKVLESAEQDLEGGLAWCVLMSSLQCRETQEPWDTPGSQGLLPAQP